MIIDAKTLLSTTTALLSIGLLVGAIAASATGVTTMASFGAFLAGAVLLLGNLVLGAVLVHRVTHGIATGSSSMPMLALMFKTFFLFGSFLGLGLLLGMAPVAFGAAATLVSFMGAVVLVSTFTPQPASIA